MDKFILGSIIFIIIISILMIIIGLYSLNLIFIFSGILIGIIFSYHNLERSFVFL